MIFYILQDMSINYELTRGDAKGIYNADLVEFKGFRKWWYPTSEGPL